MASTKNDNDIEEQKTALRNFLKDTESLDKLEMLADDENIFNILSVENAEIRHSNFLAWLLDPSGNHRLGDAFLKKFLYEYSESSGTEKKVDIFDIDRMDLSDSIVYRELYNMDIVIQSKQSKFVLVIENKIRSSERQYQTTDYRKRVQKEFGAVENKFFVFLTIGADEAEDKEWVSIGHHQILKIIRTLLNRLPEGSRRRIYVEDYIQTMERMMNMGESDIERICAEIYAKHKKAIDILVENIPDDFYKRADYFKEMVKGTEGLIYREDSNNSYVKFTTQKIIDKIGLFEAKGGKTSEDLLHFGIVNNRDGTIRFTLSVDPCEDEEKRIQLLNYLYPKFHKGAKEVKRNSARVYSESFTYDEDSDGYDLLKKKFDTFVNEKIPEKIMPVIESFPGFE